MPESEIIFFNIFSKKGIKRRLNWYYSSWCYWYRSKAGMRIAFLFHKAATFIDREDEQKQAKDLYYIYFILRYAPDLEPILEEVKYFNKKGYLNEAAHNIETYFKLKTSKGCLLIEKENGPDYYLDDLRQDIYEKFSQFRSVL